VNGSTVEHIPVLAETLTEQINLPPDGIMVDATIGQGGHSFLLGKTLGPEAVIVGFDVDNDAVRRARSKLEPLACKVILIDSNFSAIGERLHELGIEGVDLVLADLGVSSAQLADAEFGLSFQANMPLDMRLDKRLEHTAADIVNKEDEKTLADLIYKFGEDRASRRRSLQQANLQRWSAGRWEEESRAEEAGCTRRPEPFRRLELP
jgi:16S rRNA (cytosine1402-N4)-methyltransferase